MNLRKGKEKIQERIFLSRYLQFCQEREVARQLMMIEVAEFSSFKKWMFPMLYNLQQSGQKYEIVVVCQEEIKGRIQEYMGDLPLKLSYTSRHTMEYVRLLACAGKLLVEHALPDFYKKRKDQYCIKYGTTQHQPKKNQMGQMQRTLLLSDVVVEISVESGEQLVENYFLQQLFCGKFLIDEKGTAWFLEFLFGEASCEQLIPEKNGRENVLIYPGALGENGITRSFFNLLDTIDLQKRNYFVCFREKYMSEALEQIGQLPPEVGIVGWSGDTARTIWETGMYFLKFKCRKFPKITNKVIEKLYQRESRRRFQRLPISTCIQFAGYEKEMIRLFGEFPGRKIIYVHNDMVAEIREKGRQDFDTLQIAYQTYDHVAIVAEGLRLATVSISEQEENLTVVPNCQKNQVVQERAEQPIVFDSWTASNVAVEELARVLDSSCEKFINIGRFSPEKGHEILLSAFEAYHREYPESYLIIIGGEGSCYEEVMKLVKENAAADHILVIKSMGNPMPVLKKCDCFVLSSYYEGLPMVFFEADILGLPIISTDINGPRQFLQKYHGCLVPATSKGIYEGMKKYKNGEVQPIAIDFGQYNREAAEAFEQLFLEEKDEKDKNCNSR